MFKSIQNIKKEAQPIHQIAINMKLGRLERIETMAMKREMQEDRIDLISAGALI